MAKVEQLQVSKRGSLSRRAGWPVLFGVTALEAAAAAARLALIPADPKNALLLGFSASRLAMMAVLLAAAALSAWLSWAARRSQMAARLQGLLEKRGLFLAVVGALLAALVSWSVLVYLHSYPGDALLSQYTRVAPLLYFAVLACLQAVLALVWMRLGLHFDALRSEKPVLLLAGGILGVFLLLWLLIALTGLGIVPDSMAWGIPGVPLLAYQVLFAAGGGGLLLLFVGLRLPRAGLLAGQVEGNQLRRLDGLVAALIWLAAAAAWISQPMVLRSYFAPEVRAPNYEIYPFSDAGFYEYTAQSVVVGEGFQNGEIVPRPLFILGLAIINALGGPGYSQIVFLQTLLLALFPVLLYFLGLSLHSRSAGILAAGLAIIREVNAIAATPLTTVSNSKLILSDFPTALAMAAFTLLLVRWLRAPHARRWAPLVAGGGLGLLMLIRTQSVMLAPFVLLVALLLYWPRRLRWVEAVLLFGLGTGLVVAPWLWRNYQITGQIVFDQLTQTVPLADRYSLNGAPKQLPGENDGEYTARLMAGVRQFILQHPDQVVKFAAAHFLNNEIHTLLALPSLWKPADVRDTLRVDSPFWENWNGQISLSTGGLLLLNLALIAVGLAAAWRRLGWVGLLPLVINIAYAASNAVARNSGWRYMLPADWVSYFYFAAGLAQALLWLAALTGAAVPSLRRAAVPAFVPNRFPYLSAAAAAAAFLLIGGLLPLSEVVVPQRYPPQTKAEILAEVTALEVTIKPAALEQFALSDDVVVIKGRALYPRFYKAGEGEPTNEWKAYIPRDFPRLAFLVLNQAKWNVNLRVEKSPVYFPNAADVVVIGCKERTGIDPALVVVLGASPAAYTRMDISPLTCPLPEVR